MRKHLTHCAQETSANGMIRCTREQRQRWRAYPVAECIVHIISEEGCWWKTRFVATRWFYPA